METRLDPFTSAPETMQAMLALEQHVRKCGLESSLIHLVKARASHINGCAYCIHMHTLEARNDGESEERLYVLSAWRESPLYTAREQAALAWTEALTQISETHASDEEFDQVRRQFTEEEVVQLTLLIGAINIWNRIAIGFRFVHPTANEVETGLAGAKA